MRSPIATYKGFTLCSTGPTYSCPELRLEDYGTIHALCQAIDRYLGVCLACGE